MMDYRKEFLVEPGRPVRLSKLDAGYKGKQVSQQEALTEIQKHLDKLRKLQYLLYAEKRHAMLIVLQALDAGGKDGTLNHVMSAMNPQGTSVTGFRQPTAEELQHDFLWRVHSHAPARGTVAIFNRSHYEDVLVVRVHKLVGKEVWSARYDFINDFEKLLRCQNDTVIIKFFLHISRQEQLERFKQRLDDPARNWKISQSDYEEREYWDAYTEAYEEVFAKTSKEDAPWYIIPSDHKWFRNLAVSQIVAATMENLGMKMPKPQVDLDEIRKKYHEALEQDDDHRSESSRKKK
jgi:PPK2 family polyphosphate:nucleotide phosphotransferase